MPIVTVAALTMPVVAVMTSFDDRPPVPIVTVAALTIPSDAVMT